MMSFEFTPGSLVQLRNRPWIVQPSDDADLFLVKPLGGGDDEITGIYKPCAFPSDVPTSYNFTKPGVSDLGDFSVARLLYNAARLSFRQAAGPFRSLGKLSFRPRSYQMVPLIMALRQETVRLLIADDVGVGKTIEALLIAKELLDRREIQRFAIVCLPHLCDQWQEELKSKFGLEAVIIRSGTVRGLERQLRGSETIFRAFPYQIISIDFIKASNKRQTFLDHCPELVIVDEAHTCARPEGAHTSQQLRYHLLHDLARKANQHILLLTATPHSGKPGEFSSILGLLKPEFERLEVTSAGQQERKDLAQHVIQRRRGDIIKWLDEETPFPRRLTKDGDYEISSTYAELLDEILEYARQSIVTAGDDARRQRYRYWDALALLRGVTSSPAAGVSMLLKKAAKKRLDTEDADLGNTEDEDERSVLDSDYSGEDTLPLHILSRGEESGQAESRRLIQFAKRLEVLGTIKEDNKARETAAQVKDWIQRGYSPILFCRYIHTANYLGEMIRQALSGKEYRDVHIEVVTSELNDDLRREKIVELSKSTRRLLVATDCLSEGINLQDGFNAVLHYDLPWNPNRLEQREGRVDRFGQQSETVEVLTLYGKNNPVDGVVLDILLRKAKEIHQRLGIYVPFPENSMSVTQALMKSLLLKPSVRFRSDPKQLTLFIDEELNELEEQVDSAWQEAENRTKATRTIFAQHAIKAQEIEHDLEEIDHAIGNVQAVERFVTHALPYLGVQVDSLPKGYRVYTTNLPERLRHLLTEEAQVCISFRSPTPAGYMYLGRNHPFVEHLCQTILDQALQQDYGMAARSAVVRTRAVREKTVLFQFRVRNVIAEQPANREIVAEEMWLWGYRGMRQDGHWLTPEEARALLLESQAVQNVPEGEQIYWLNEELKWINNDAEFRQITDPIALQRADELVSSHQRFRKLVSGSRYKVVEPVLPMDVLGIYILLNEIE